MTNDIFNSSYVEPEKATQATSNKSETKKFLKEAIKPKEMEMYGSSKPKRVLIKAKVF